MGLVAAGPLARARPTDDFVATVAAAGPQAKFYGYLTPVVVVQKGDSLTFSSFDLEQHDFVQDTQTDGFGGSPKMPWCKKVVQHHGDHEHGEECPVFWTKLIGLGQSTDVKGIDQVKPGTVYSFLCTIHPGMKGKLVVAS